MRRHAKIWSMMIALACLLGLIIVEKSMLGDQPTVMPNIMDLSGEWLFVEGRSFEDINTSVHEALRVSVPDHWNRYDVGRQGNKAFGHGTFVRTVQLPPELVDVPLAMRITNVGMAYRVYVNGQLRATMGSVGPIETTATAAKPTAAKPTAAKSDAYAMRNVPQIIPVVVEGPSFELAIEVANWDYAPYGGIVSPIYVGEAQTVLGMQNRAQLYETIFNTSYFVVGIIFAVLFAYRRKALFLLYFALYNFTGMVYMLTHGEKLWYLIAPNFEYVWFTKIQYGSAAINLTFLLLYVYYSFPQLFRNRLTQGLIGLSLVFYPAVLLPLKWQSLWSAPQMALIQIVSIYLLYKFIYGILTGQEYALYVGFSAIMSLVMVTNAIFIVMGWSTVDLWMVTAQLVWVLMHAFLIAARLSRTYDLVEDQARALVRQDQIKDTFLAKTSHEFRTPLHGIINMTELFLERNSSHLSQQDKEGLVQVTEIAKRLSRLVNDLLEVAKLNEGKVAVKAEPVDVAKLVVDVATVLRVAHGDLNPKIEVGLADQVPLALADRDRVKQVLINLVDNALLHTSGTRVWLGVSLSADGQWVRVDVQDFGHGIADNQLDLIFEPFHTHSDFEHQRRMGVGLGLSIVKELVGHMQGRIEVTSKLHEGTVFTVYLPVAPGAPAGEVAPSHQAKGQATPALEVQEGLVLVVDDEPANIMILMEALGTDGYRVHAASTGQEALGLLQMTQDYDLVILDVMLPDVSGYEVAQLIRQNYNVSELPILFLTAGMGLMDAQIAFKYGGNDFLNKPFHLPELRARSKSLIAMKQAASLRAQYEIAFLNAQIKPHFLYNALNTIAAVCERGSDQAVDLIISLARYLRGTLDFSNLEMLTPLDRELELVDAYLTIEKARFEGLVVHNHIDPSLALAMPTLGLQILVENAIKHSYKDRANHMVLVLSAEKVRVHDSSDWGIRLSVADNGPGMTDEQVEHILVQPTTNEGIGLYNLNQRLMRMVGSRLEIDTVLGRGTVVSFVVRTNDRGNLDN